jgi:hypothetical protein
LNSESAATYLLNLARFDILALVFMGIQVLWDITLLPLVNIPAKLLELENRAIKAFGDFGTYLPNITVDIPQDSYLRF